MNSTEVRKRFKAWAKERGIPHVAILVSPHEQDEERTMAKQMGRTIICYWHGMLPIKTGRGGIRFLVCSGSEIAEWEFLKVLEEIEAVKPKCKPLRVPALPPDVLATLLKLLKSNQYSTLVTREEVKAALKWAGC